MYSFQSNLVFFNRGLTYSPLQARWELLQGHMTTGLYNFEPVTDTELLKIISCMHKTTCSSDPFPTRLLMSHIHAIVPILQHIVNLCLTTGDFPISCKSSIVIPLIKKPGLD